MFVSAYKSLIQYNLPDLTLLQSISLCTPMLMLYFVLFPLHCFFVLYISTAQSATLVPKSTENLSIRGLLDETDFPEYTIQFCFTISTALRKEKATFQNLFDRTAVGTLLIFIKKHF